MSSLRAFAMGGFREDVDVERRAAILCRSVDPKRRWALGAMKRPSLKIRTSTCIKNGAVTAE
jgi:hypothetical protein